MKENWNQTKRGEYYLGLDIGTDSVGWAVTDTSAEYHLLRFRGNVMQGITLFDGAEDNKARRRNRTNRRRTARSAWRLLQLESLFTPEIVKVDPTFFIRLRNSFLLSEDKDEAVQQANYTLFHDPDFTDVEYMQAYPTIYHLRQELVRSPEPHDIRLVYLAIHHIVKKRGHFLYDGDADMSLEHTLKNLEEYLRDNYGAQLQYSETAQQILCNQKLTITQKKRELCKEITLACEDEAIDQKALADLLAGASVDLSKLFHNEEYVKTKLRLSDDLDETYDELQSVLGEDMELVLVLKTVFNAARMTAILGKHSYICDAKVELFEKNHRDLQRLKAYVREHVPEKYKAIFSEMEEKRNNFAAYAGKDAAYTCDQEAFCTYLKHELPELANCPGYEDMWAEIQDNRFFRKLSSKDNGVIPNQIHRKELKQILEHAKSYLPFLCVSDAYGSVADKILAVFDFRIPYYVGPLNRKSDKAWVVRKDEKILPWNLNQVVDQDASAAKFMENLIGRCEYTGAPVLPKDSLLYSEFMLLNVVNLLRVNGQPLDNNVKQTMIRALFYDSDRPVSRKMIKDYLLHGGFIKGEDAVTGMDERVKLRLKSYHTFRRILDKYRDREMVEQIIQGILVYGEDKRLLRQWLKKNYAKLEPEDVDYVCRLKFRDWGRLSRVFLEELYMPDANGEAVCLMDMLRRTSCNLMQLLSDTYDFGRLAEEYMRSHYAPSGSLRERLDEMYISPGTRRAVWQAVKITEEITDIMKAAPKKIFIEVAREHRPDEKQKLSRKEMLLELYDKCGETGSELYDHLCETDDYQLRDMTLYLYYRQLGKCMYSGEPIDLYSLANHNRYDIDHIYPFSKVPDDSQDNKVLVKSELNREKTNVYPISEDIRRKMTGFWMELKRKNLISEKKYERLVRSTPLDAEELAAFMNRQLVETQQSTKAVATLFKELFGEAGTKIVYSKAVNVSKFRNRFHIVKSRDLNDLHHAKDAYLNIVVGNVYDTKYTSEFFANILHEKHGVDFEFNYDVPGAWKAKESTSIRAVKASLNKQSVRYTCMPKEQKGQISKQTILPAGQGQLPIKRGLSIERYGGYSDISGAFFMLVEHTEKKKRIRTIEPVYVYAKSIWTEDPVRYCTQVLGLTDPVVVEPKIFIKALLELDGCRYHITGRSVGRIVCQHAYQLVLNAYWTCYIKEISEYADACKALNQELDAKKFKQGKRNIEINADHNLELYDVFTEKLSHTVYKNVLGAVQKSVEQGRDAFTKLSVLEQCQELLEILKAFHCNRVLSNLKPIGGAANAGALMVNKNISKCEQAYLIHHSVTGLYEYRTNLLREI